MLVNNLLSLHARHLCKNVIPSRVRPCVSMSDAPSAAPKVGKLCMIGAPQLEQLAVSMFPKFSLVPDLKSMQSNTHVPQPHAPLDAVIIGPHLQPSSGGTPPHPSQPPASPSESPAAPAPAPAPAPPASSASASASASPSYTAQLARITMARAVCPTAFIVMWHPLAVEDAPLRVAGFEAGANMVTHCEDHLVTALARVSDQEQGGAIQCDWCGMQGLTPQGYYLHQQLYHINHPNLGGVCQVCGHTTSNIARHLHDTHPPPGVVTEERTGMFALAVVRRKSDGRFLLCQEFACSGFWLPGGGVDRGESLQAGAVREAREEAGVDVVLTGVLAVEVHAGGQWRRVIFLAEPLDEAQPAKTVPDFDSAGAAWVDVGQLLTLPLRSPSELQWVVHVAKGGRVLPLAMPAKFADTFSDWEF